MEITEQIKDVIKKNLPAQIGEVLRGQLEELETKREQVTSLEKELRKSKEENARQSEKISELIRYRGIEEKLDLREKELEKRELRLDTTLLQVKLDEANKRADIVSGFTSGLVRNTVFREEVFKNRLTKLKDSTGYEYVDMQPDNQSVTKEQE